MASVHTSAVPHLPVFEKREELGRILECKYFANSPKKSRFLEFVAERTFLERARRELYSHESRAVGTVGSIVAQPRLVLRRGRVNRHGEPAAAVAAY